MMKILLLLVFLAVAGCQSHSQPELHLFMWGHYIKPEIIQRFEQEYGCRIVLDTYDSNEAMYAKLKLGTSGYDLIFPSNYFFEIMLEQGMLRPINLKKISNYKNLDPAYLKFTSPSYADYGIPYMVSHTGIAYRSDKIKEPVHSWGIFASREYKGRMTMLNDIREAIGAALRYQGYSANSINPKEVEKAADLLIHWKRNLAKFESEQYKNGIDSAEYLIVQGYSGDILQVMQENPHIQFIYPEEGSMMSIDFLVIPADAPNPALAQTFINYLLQGEIAAENITYTRYLSPVLPAYEKLDSKLRESDLLFPSDQVLEKSELIKNLHEAYIYYIKAWERIKAAD